LGDDQLAPIVVNEVTVAVAHNKSGRPAGFLPGHLVLLTTCFNIANLVVARGGAAKEIGVHICLEAKRGRVIAQMPTESLLLAGLRALRGCSAPGGALKPWQRPICPARSVFLRL